MKIEIYGRPGCGLCVAARNVCEKAGMEYLYYQLDEDYVIEHLFERVKFKTFPQKFVNEEHVGGYTEFTQMLTDKMGGLI